MAGKSESSRFLQMYDSMMNNDFDDEFVAFNNFNNIKATNKTTLCPTA